MRNYVFYFFLSILLTACASPNWQPISSDMIWTKDQKITFDIKLGNEGERKIDLLVRHNAHYAFKNVPTHITVTGPNNYSFDKIVNVPVRDESQLFIGDAMGDIVDVTYELPLKITSKGDYKLTIQSAAEEALPNIMEFGYEFSSDN